MASNESEVSKDKDTRSSVWQYFKKNATGDKTTCTLCQRDLVFKGGSTSSMKKHIRNVHKSIMLDNPSRQATVGTKVVKQTTLMDFRKPKLPPPSKTRQDEFVKALAWMCAVDLRPINIVTGIGFKRVCYVLNPTFTVPSRPTVAKHLNLLYDEVKEELISKMEGRHVAITTDMWTSVANIGYITVTAHFITDDWKLECHVLGTRHVDNRHTGVNLALEIAKLTKEFKIKEVVCITTDNARNIQVAARESELFRVPCFAHTVQLAVSDAITAKKFITSCLAKCRKLVSY